MPISLVVAVLVIKAFGGSINTMTLGGLTIALGVIVDDVIIVVENITRRLRENAARISTDRKSETRVVYEATREIQTAIVYATAIIMLVFVPIFFLTSVEGRLLIPLGLAYIVALAASLVVAVAITPVLSVLFLPKSQVVNRVEETAVIRKMKAACRPILEATVARWRVVGAPAALLLALSLLALAFTGRSFLPSFNEGSLTVSAVTLPGTSLEQSDRLGNMVERRLLEQPEVVATSRRTGRAELDEHVQGVNASEIDVVLDMRDRSKEVLLADIRQSLSGIPGVNINIGQPVFHRIDHMLSGTRSNIAVNIFGPDLYELRRIAEQFRAVMEGVTGVVDLSVEQQADIPVLTVELRRDIIAQYGLTIREVSEALETALAGHEVSRILEGQASYDLVVRYPQSSRENLDKVREILLTTASGAQVPLHGFADIRRDSGPNRISRQNVQRKITVMANVAEEDLVTVVDKIRRNVSASVTLLPSYRVEYGGQFESAVSASRMGEMSP
jgi:Cu/Ag efflux pump CusA